MRALLGVLLVGLCLTGCAGAQRFPDTEARGERKLAWSSGSAGDAEAFALYVFAIPVACVVVGAVSITVDAVLLPITYGLFDEPFCVTRGLIALGRSVTSDDRPEKRH